MALALVEKPPDEAYPLGGWRSQPQLVALLGEPVGILNILVRIHQVAVIVVEIGAVTEQRVIEVGVVRIVEIAVKLPLQIGAGIGEVEIPDLALDGERSLDPFIHRSFGIELLNLQLAKARFLGEEAAALLILTHDLRSHGPCVVEVDLEGGDRKSTRLNSSH